FGWVAVAVGFGGAFVLAIVYYYFRVHYSYYGRLSLGLTTTFVIPLAFFLGALVGVGRFLEAGLAAIACVYLLVEKKELRELGESMTKQELLDLLVFIVIAFIIYPNLPAGEVRVLWLGFNVQYFWLIVVVVSAISFAGHVLAKYYRDKAVFYTAFLGGLVSSLATTVLFLKKTRDKRVVFSAVVCAALASTISNAGVVLIANPFFFERVLPLALALSALYAATAWFSVKKLRGETDAVKVERHALSLRFAIEFAFVFFFVSLVLANLATNPASAVTFAFFSGLVSSTSVWAAAAYAFGAGALPLRAALLAVAFASIGSLAAKTTLASLAVKNTGLRVRLAALLVLALAASVATAVLSS
ncbi:MAG: DUF4010 domain-containing protein, partial [Candidatus Norongarragalinales archaeon]